MSDGGTLDGGTPAAPSAPPERESGPPERLIPDDILLPVLAWVSGGVNSVQRARDAQRIIDAIAEARDDEIRVCWENRKGQVRFTDLSRLTGVSKVDVVMALHRHPTRGGD